MPEQKRPTRPQAELPKRYLSPPLTRPELRAAFQAAGIDPRRATAEERETARALPATTVREEPDTSDAAKWNALLGVLERIAEREEDRRGRRDSIADAEERATDAGELLSKKTVDAQEAAAFLTKWWKVAAVVIGSVVVGGSACGSTVFGYLAASKGAADNTKGVATEAAEKAVKEAPKPVERERVIYVERAPAPTPSAYQPIGDQ